MNLTWEPKYSDWCRDGKKFKQVFAATVAIIEMLQSSRNRGTEARTSSVDSNICFETECICIELGISLKYCKYM